MNRWIYLVFLLPGLLGCNSRIVLPDNTPPVIERFYFWGTEDQGGLGPLTVQVHAADNIGVEQMELRKNGQLVQTISGPLLSFDDNITEEGTYTFEVTARDRAGNVVKKQEVFEAKNVDWMPPQLVRVETNQTHFAAPGTLQITIEAVDNAGMKEILILKNGILYQTLGNPSLADPFVAVFSDAITSPGTYTYDYVLVDVSGNSTRYGQPIVVVADF